jgi:ABC-type multidrug transport system fused ATPase/permease subunit
MTLPESLLFLYVFYFISILLHISSAIIVTKFVIPLQIRESKVQNGLLSLRRELLRFGITILVISILTVITLSVRFFVSNTDIARVVSVILVLVHSMTFLYLSTIIYRIYNTQYTPEQKDLHRRMSQAEKVVIRKGVVTQIVENKKGKRVLTDNS